MGPWRLHFYFNEIKAISSSSQVSFSQARRLVNGMTDSLVKQGVDRVFPFFASHVVVLCYLYENFIPALLLLLVLLCLVCMLMFLFNRFMLKKKKKTRERTYSAPSTDGLQK